MSVLKKVDNLLNNLSNIIDTDNISEEIKSLNTRISELSENKEKILEKNKEIDLFTNTLNINDLDENITVADTCLSELTQNFKSKPKSATITNGQNYKNLLNASSEIFNNLENHIQNSLKKFIEKLGIEKPEEIYASLAQTEENIKKLNEYKNCYEDFRIILKDEVLSNAKLKKLEEISSKLKSFSFDKDIPKFMHKFFNDTNNGIGFNFDHLTDEMNNWLKEKNIRNSYVIKKN